MRHLCSVPGLKSRHPNHFWAHAEALLTASNTSTALPRSVCRLNCQGQLSFQREKIKALSSFNLILLLHQWS